MVMNERIQELARQASGQTFGHIRNAYFEKKFAELIVRECIAKAEEEAELYRGFSHLEGADLYAKVMYNYQVLLKEHFGVEE
jgi:hypothetical protein